MAEEFEVKVLFTGFDDQLLKQWAKETKFAADAMLTVVGTMETQIAALNSIKEELRSISDSFSGGTGPVGGGVGGSDPHLVNAIKDLSSVIRANRSAAWDIQAAGQGYGGGSGGKGMGLPDDESKSFNPITLPNARFGFQDLMRQGAHGLGWFGDKDWAARPAYSYYNRETGEYSTTSQQQLDDRYKAWANGPDIGPRPKDDLLDEADPDVFRMGPAPNRLQGASTIMHQIAEASPYFYRGGLLNPGTYANTVQRFGGILNAPGVYSAQNSGTGASYNPLADSNRSFFGSMFQAGTESWFGFNPRMPFGAAMGIESNFNLMGYSGDDARRLNNATSDIVSRLGGSKNIDPKIVSNLMDQSFRWGYASIDQFTQAIGYELPAAAKAARISVSEFSQEMVTAVAAISQSGVINPYQAIQQVNAAALGAGYSPGQTAALVNNQTNTMWGYAIQASTGDFHYSDAISGTHAVSEHMEARKAALLSVLGGVSFADARRIMNSTGDSEAKKNIQDSYDWAMQHMPGFAEQMGNQPLSRNLNQLSRINQTKIAETAQTDLNNVFKLDDKEAWLRRAKPAGYLQQIAALEAQAKNDPETKNLRKDAFAIGKELGYSTHDIHTNLLHDVWDQKTQTWVGGSKNSTLETARRVEQALAKGTRQNQSGTDGSGSGGGGGTSELTIKLDLDPKLASKLGVKLSSDNGAYAHDPAPKAVTNGQTFTIPVR